MQSPPTDDFKWFGEGFDGFPKRLPDDVVEYIIFSMDSTLSDVQTRERLQAFQRAMTDLKKKFLKEYIWQRESINLELVHEEGRWLLKGATNYGDSVADEWLIVYFLRELSNQFPDAWIRVYDTDGEFLLIEAANALPKWLNPEVAENRVWINNHELKLIPLDKEAVPGPLKLEDALKIIKNTPNNLQRVEAVETEAFHRLKSYPKAIAENQHHATLPLPRKLAYVLLQNPAYISPAVEAFYLRDPISLRLIQPSKSERPLNFPPEDFVTVSVRFTKVLYAQLRSQEWVPPSPWGEALAELTGNASAIQREKAEIAIKLAVGFEMLVQNKLFNDRNAAREIQLLLEDLKNGEDELPTDEEIKGWDKREDDESWLDIDFADFERELAGKSTQPVVGPSQEGRGFGDKSAQDNLQRMVKQFEKFIADEGAGIEGAQGLDPMDVDDDSEAERDWEDPESGQDSDDEDGEDEEFDEEEYKRAIETIMGISAAEKSILTDEARELANKKETDRDMEEELRIVSEMMEDLKPGNRKQAKDAASVKKPVTTEVDEDSEAEEIRKISEQFEAELKSHGALNLNQQSSSNVPSVKNTAKGKGKAKGQQSAAVKGKGKAKVTEVDDSGDDLSSDEELLDIDYNLAKNMLEALKGQGGMAGPAGNLMGLMGLQFPPDADDDKKPGKGGRS